MGVVHTAVHNGASVSVAHNLRLRYITDKEEHIDPTGEHETWYHEDVAQAYEKLFGQAIRDYNEKQKRKDRRLDENYIKTISEDPYKHVMYEFIVGVYPQEADTCPDWIQKEVLRRYVDEFRKNNPNLHVVGAYFHADEPGAGFHVHLDYIPVGHFDNYGMKVQNSLTRALKEQGMTLRKSDKDRGEDWRTAQMQLQDRERDRLDALCREHGLVVEHPVIEGKAEKQEHMRTETYKAEKRLETTIDHYTDMERLADEQLRRADREDARAQKAVERAGRATDAEQQARERKKALESEIRALKGTYDAEVGIQKKTAGKTLLGKPKTNIEIPYTEYQELHARANAVDNILRMQAELDREKVITAEQQKQLSKALHDAKSRENRAQDKERSLDERIENRAQELISGKTKLMERYLKDHKFSDGKTLYEDFMAQEHIREQQQHRGISR